MEGLPRGAQGDDRWISIAAFTDEQWVELTDVLGLSELVLDTRFSSMDDRLAHQDELETLIDIATRDSIQPDLRDAPIEGLRVNPGDLGSFKR